MDFKRRGLSFDNFQERTEIEFIVTKHTCGKCVSESLRDSFILLILLVLDFSREKQFVIK